MTGDGIVGEGESFGPYRLESLLGRGGMGEVWRAFDGQRERAVAVKRLSATWTSDVELEARFRREAQATARLSSVHVIPIHDFGEIDGRLFVDMRLVTGGDLARLVADHPRGLAPDRAVELAEQIADALASAHGAGLVHRDVKPSNVLLTGGSGRDFCYLVDFGIAKLAEDAAATRLTATGTLLGTLAYLAPELFDGAERAGVPSDVYALGCVLYEMLTGTRAFPDRDLASLRERRAASRPPRPSAVVPALAPFDDVLARALATDPADRHPDTLAFARDARAALGDGGAGWSSGAGAAADGASGLGGAAGPGGAAAAHERPGETTVRVPASRAAGRSSTAAMLVLAVLVLVAAGAATALALVSPRAQAPVDAPVSALSASPQSSIQSPSTQSPSTLPPSAPVPAGPALRPTAVPAGLRLTAPSGVTTSSDGRRLFVADPGFSDAPGTTLVAATVDPATGLVSGSTAVAVGQRPQQVAVTPDGRRAYVTVLGVPDAPGDVVAVVDTATDAVVATVPVGVDPTGVAVSPDGRRAYVVDTGVTGTPGAVTVLDTASGAVVGTVPVGVGPVRVAVSPDGSRAYVSESGSDKIAGSTVAVIDTTTLAVVGSLQVGGAPVGLTVSADGRTLFVADWGTANDPRGSLLAVDTRSGTSFPVAQGLADGPWGLGLTPDGRHLLVANNGSDDTPGSTVLVIDPATRAVQSTVPVLGRPLDMVAAPDGRTAYVSTDRGVSVIRLY